MALIKVTSSALTQQAAQIESLKGKLENKFKALNSLAAQLNSSWQGGAHDDFVKSVRTNEALLERFTNNAKKFADALKTGATNYEGGEGKARQIASTKR